MAARSASHSDSGAKSGSAGSLASAKCNSAVRRPSFSADLVQDPGAMAGAAGGDVFERAEHARRARRLAMVREKSSHLELGVDARRKLTIDLEQKALPEHDRRIGLLPGC